MKPCGHQSGGPLKAILWARRTAPPAEFDCHVLAFDEARCFQAVAEGSDKVRKWRGRSAAHEPNDRHRPLLRPRRERPCRRAAEQGDEFTPCTHSITSSARASNVGGT